MSVTIDHDVLRYQCPHCKLWTEVHKQDINCKIFRHAVYKKDFKPINPHASLEQVKKIRNQIIGCGGPHMLVPINDTWIVKSCSW